MNICRIKLFTVVLAVAAIIGLGPIGFGNSASAAATMTCEELNGMVIPAASIGLPATGAMVTSTEVVPAAREKDKDGKEGKLLTGAKAIGEYCLVKGEINPVDPDAPKILFHVALPTKWNEKALMFGAGVSTAVSRM
jgi:hypothetical protein